MKATAQEEGDRPSFAPPSLEEVVARIKEVKPAVLFLPHVETSAGIIVSHDYIKAVAEAVHAGDPDAIVVLDCIASGNCWTNMSELGVDCLITAPQKGW